MYRYYTQSIYQSINELLYIYICIDIIRKVYINQSMNRSVDPIIDRSIDRSIDPLIDQ